MAEPFLGEIKLVPYTFAPRGFAFCAGQLLAISQNAALFSLLGTTYGGNGTVNFALPDLRGRAAIHFGTLAGGSTYTQGEVGGSETVTLTTSQLPVHAHNAVVAAVGGTSAADAGGRVPASGGPDLYASTSGAVLSTTAAGSGLPHENMAPYLVLNFVIALTGIFPARN
jgi:microcystin-dependent protein